MRHYIRIVVALTAMLLAVGAGAAEQAKLYDVDSSGTDIKFVLEALARRSGANIVVSPEITGPINAHLKQMPIESILDYLAAVEGFGWKSDNNTYLVASKDKLNPPEQKKEEPAPALEVYVYQCKNVKAAELMDTVARTFPSLKVAEGPSAASPILNAQDTGLSSASAIRLSTSNTASSSNANSSSTPTKNSTRIVIVGIPSDIEGAKSLLDQLDVPRKQVSIEVSVMEINSNASKDVGIDWSWTDYKITDNTASSGINFGKFSKSSTDVTGTISLLVKSGEGTLLAKPNVSVLDGESAGILIGSKLKYRVISGYTTDGQPIYSTEEQPVGISLQIAARVAGDNGVILALYPQVSSLTGYVDNLPQISTREAQTTVSVKDGTTLAIGGLMNDNEISSSYKVPLLGDIPILGQFFKHNTKTKERTEIVIFLTPKIVES